MELKLAMIGGWGHASNILEEIETLPDFNLVALAKALPEEDPSHFRRFRSVKDAPLFDDYRQMLEKVRPQVVIIGTRLDQIASIAMAAANAGCHIICEKPLATTHASLAALYETVTRRGVVCIPMLSNSTHPVVRAAREIIDRGELGKVALVNARKTYKWGDRPEWFGRRDLYGGTIGWIGIHALDFVQAAIGQEYVSVAAMGSNVVHPERAECEDNCALILGLSGGGSASISIDLLRPNAAATWGADWMRIVGARGELEADLEHKTLHLTTQDSPRREVPVGATWQNYLPFLKGIAGKSGVTPPEMARGFLLTHQCLCARDAADERKIVSLARGPYRP